MRPSNSNASDAIRIPRILVTRSLECLQLSVGTQNALLKAGFTTLGDLDGLSANDLLVFSSIGPKRANEISLAAKAIAEDSERTNRYRYRMIIPLHLEKHSINRLDIDPIMRRCLIEVGCTTVGDLNGLTRNELVHIDGHEGKRLSVLKSAISQLEAGSLSTNFSIPPHLEDASTDSLNLRPSIRRALRDLGCDTLKDLKGISREDLLSLSGVGVKSVDNMESELSYLSQVPPPSLVRLCTHTDSGCLILPRVPHVLLDAMLRARCLRDEIGALVAGLSERNAQLFLRRISFDKGPRPTLETLGYEFGISRERVRQLNAARSRMLRKSGLRLPIASSVVALLEKAGGMLTMDQLVEVIRQAHIRANRVDLVALQYLHEMNLIPMVEWHEEYGIWVTEHGKTHWIDSGRFADQVNVARRLAQREFRRVGAISKTDHINDSGIDEQKFTHLSLALQDYKLIDWADWLVVDPTVDCAVHRVARKILLVTSPLSMSELYLGLNRARNLHPLPPPAVVQRVLLAHPNFCRIGASMGLTTSVQETGVLSAAEVEAIDVLRKADGVVETYEFVDEMVKRGFSEPRAQQILHGPFTKSPSVGIYVLRGYFPPGQLVEKKTQKRHDRRGKSIVSVTQPGRRKVEVTYRLARHNLDGVLTAPPQIPSSPENWDGRDDVGRCLEITVRNNFLWGIRTWLAGHQAREGDLVIATFHTELGRVEFDFIRKRTESNGE